MSGYSMLSDLLMIDDLWMSHTEITTNTHYSYSYSCPIILTSNICEVFLLVFLFESGRFIFKLLLLLHPTQWVNCVYVVRKSYNFRGPGTSWKAAGSHKGLLSFWMFSHSDEFFFLNGKKVSLIFEITLMSFDSALRYWHELCLCNTSLADRMHRKSNIPIKFAFLNCSGYLRTSQWMT